MGGFWPQGRFSYLKHCALKIQTHHLSWCNFSHDVQLTQTWMIMFSPFSHSKFKTNPRQMCYWGGMRVLHFNHPALNRFSFLSVTVIVTVAIPGMREVPPSGSFKLWDAKTEDMEDILCSTLFMWWSPSAPQQGSCYSKRVTLHHFPVAHDSQETALSSWARDQLRSTGQLLEALLRSLIKALPPCWPQADVKPSHGAA